MTDFGNGIKTPAKPNLGECRTNREMLWKHAEYVYGVQTIMLNEFSNLRTENKKQDLVTKEIRKDIHKILEDHEEKIQNNKDNILKGRTALKVIASFGGIIIVVSTVLRILGII